MIHGSVAFELEGCQDSKKSDLVLEDLDVQEFCT